MKKPMKIFLLGTALAFLIFFGGYLVTIYDHSQLSDLIEKCKAENAQYEKSPDPEGWMNAPLVCDPGDLLLSPSLVGIQRQIAEAQASSGHTQIYAVRLAAAVFILFSTPASWYFLLRRIRELRDAITGKSFGE